MFKFLIIAPYTGMKDLLEDMAEAFPYEIHVEVGDLQQGLSIAKVAEQQGYDVIISRGGTAKLIQQHVQIPVIEIAVNGYDILRSLTFLKEFPGKIGIIGFPNIVDGVDTIAELLEMQVTKFVIHREAEAESAVRKAKEHGVSLVIGDVITVTTAENAGLKAILITSGREAIIEALERANKTVLAKRIEDQEMHFLKSMLDTLEQGLIGVDSQGIVVFSNKTAAEIFGTTAELGTKLSDILSQAQIQLTTESNEAFVKVILDAGSQEKRVLITGKTMTSGGIVYTVHRNEDIQRLEKQIRRAEEAVLSLPKSQFQQFVKTEFINESYMEKAEKWSRLSDPILIMGESGTGKRSIAEAIHNRSRYHEGPFVVLHTRLVPSDQLESILFNSGKFDDNPKEALIERAEGGTLYIHHIDELPLSLQLRLVAILQSISVDIDVNKANPPFRLVASTSVDLTEKVGTKEFDQQLYALLWPHVLHLPSLRTFIEDLDHLVFWYLAEMNRSLGKQVLGMKPDVMKLMKSYHWPGNMLELKRVLKLLIESCDSSFISMQQAEPILASIFERTLPVGGQALQQLIGKNRTLEEIVSEIIQIVWQQEGFNQSVTAKRLGINRTTLWRKLNKI